MKISTLCSAIAAIVSSSALVSSFALAQTQIVNQAAVAKMGGIPQFLVDPFWPKPLPNNWLLGQVAGIRVDRFDHIWVVQRPSSLNKRELAAQENPPQAKCCVAAPPVRRAWSGSSTRSCSSRWTHRSYRRTGPWPIRRLGRVTATPRRRAWSIGLPPRRDGVRNCSAVVRARTKR